jgi:threonine dehydrogenase-like Zn-dependent dehydrogenase
MLAALLGIQRGLDVHVLDQFKFGLKPDLVRALGASYHAGSVGNIGFRPDIIIECTGAGPVISDSIQGIGNGGVVCLTGIGRGDRGIGAPTAGEIAAEVVLRNNVVVGSVNANKRHWYKASEALARTDRSWLDRLITRRERPENFTSALERRSDDIKVVVQFTEA